MKTFTQFITETKRETTDQVIRRMYELGHDMGTQGLSGAEASKEIGKLLKAVADYGTFELHQFKDSAIEGFKDGVRQRKSGAAKVNQNADKFDVCPRCNGSGHFSFNQIHGTMCYGCNGAGFVPKAQAKKMKAQKPIDPNGEAIPPEMLLGFIGTAVYPTPKRFPHDKQEYSKIKKIQVTGTGHTLIYLENGKRVSVDTGVPKLMFGIDPETEEVFDLRTGGPWKFKDPRYRG